MRLHKTPWFFQYDISNPRPFPNLMQSYQKVETSTSEEMENPNILLGKSHARACFPPCNRTVPDQTSRDPRAEKSAHASCRTTLAPDPCVHTVLALGAGLELQSLHLGVVPQPPYRYLRLFFFRERKVSGKRSVFEMPGAMYKREFVHIQRKRNNARFRARGRAARVSHRLTCRATAAVWTEGKTIIDDCHQQQQRCQSKPADSSATKY